MSPDDFIVAIKSAALKCQADTGIPASFTIAQAALESAWGKSGLAKQGNNLFGVKAGKSWLGDVCFKPTLEYLNGQWVTVQARWRKYRDWQASIDDHADFLRMNQRYAAAFLASDGEGFSRAVAAAGYATDPQYADKLISVIRSHNLAELDTAIHPKETS